MSEETRKADASTPAPKARPAPAEKAPTPAETAPEPLGNVYLVPYPKIILLYPILLAAVAAAICMHVVGGSGDQPSRVGVMVAEIFLGITAVNMVILAFDFPRTTSLTLFFALA